MKKTLFVIALAMVLALSFATIATAKYAGYAYNNPLPNSDGTTTENAFPGYLSWTGAQAIYAANNEGAPPMDTAHGGYVSTTTKCAVCHSAHRAYSAEASVAGVAPVNNSLTSGAACVNCHTVWAAGSATKKIEWENLLTTTSDDPGGPHHHADPTCTAKCHTGGVHGGGASEYNGMNAYMLGSDKDAAITTAFENGNVSTRIAYNADGAYVAEGANWFQSGRDGVPADGSVPGGTKLGTTGNRAQGNFAAAKAMATGYTCAQAGCHTSSQFAVNTWGFAENHASNPRVSGTLDKPFTGHLTGNFTHGGAAVTSGSSNPSCSPCHPGGLAGGYRTLTDATEQATNKLATSYGCDQCHDMVGKLTNTTAWPHGNRAIDVWEWNATGAPVTLAAADLPSGNLWMYKGDIAAAKLHTDPSVIAIDPSFRVVQDTIFHGTAVGNINDGVCLKCHIAIDSATLDMRSLEATSSLNPATTRVHHGGIFDNGEFETENGTGSARIFLFK